MANTAGGVVRPAFRHTKLQLLEPFRWGQWVRLAFVGLLAGEMGGLGGCNVNWPSDFPEHSGSLGNATSAGQFFHSIFFDTLIVTLTVVVIVLVVLFLYISSVMRFVLFESVVAKECRVRQGWRRRHGAGFRLFVWRLGFVCATLGAVLVIVGVPVAGAYFAGWFRHAQDYEVLLIFGAILLFLIVILIAIAFAVVDTLTKDFVVPQMALENIRAMAAWRRLWPWMKSEGSEYAVYILIKIGLSIVAAFAFILGVIVLALGLLVVFGVIALIFGVFFHLAGWSSNPFAIVAGALWAMLGLLVLGCGAALLCVPVMVFFPAYSIYFFALRYRPLALAMWPDLAASGGPGAAPPPVPA